MAQLYLIVINEIKSKYIIMGIITTLLVFGRVGHPILILFTLYTTLKVA